MDHWVKTKLIDWAAGQNAEKKTKEFLRNELETYIQELAGSQPSPIERALSETAALSWFALRLYESNYVGSTRSKDGLTIKQAEFHLRRIDRAHRRLLSTLKTLATVRWLAVPSVQINVGAQQVNQLNTGGSQGKGKPDAIALPCSR